MRIIVFLDILEHISLPSGAKKVFLDFYSTSWPRHFPRFNCRPCSAGGGSVAHAAGVALAANGFPDGWALRAHPSGKPWCRERSSYRNRSITSSCRATQGRQLICRGKRLGVTLVNRLKKLKIFLHMVSGKWYMLPQLKKIWFSNLKKKFITKIN